MSADVVGQRLLADVEEESLFKSLSTLRYTIDPQSAYRIGFDPIDDLLSAFTSVRARIASGASATPRPPCIEIASPSSNDGKSQLLYLLVAIMILPPSFGGVPIHGQNAAVLFFDADGHFDVGRLFEIMQILVAQIMARSGKRGPSLSETESMIVSALQHIHVFRPQAMASLIATLKSLPDYIFQYARHYSTHRRIAAIVLDSATAFYWNEKDDKETEKTTQPDSQKVIGATYLELKHLLSDLSLRLACTIVYTTGNAFNRSGPGSDHALPSTLPRSWFSFPALRLVVHRREVRGLPTAISAEEAARDMAARSEAVSKGVFDVRINEDGHEEWTRSVKDAVHNLERTGFVLVIDSAGLAVG